MARRQAPIIPADPLDQLLAGRDPRGRPRQGRPASSRRSGSGPWPSGRRTPSWTTTTTIWTAGPPGVGGRANRRDGQGRKTLLTASGKLPILAPRGHFPWDEAALKLLVLNLADRGGLARAPGAIRFEERCQTA